MYRLLPIVALVMLASMACKKKPPVAAVDTTTGSSDSVQIDLTSDQGSLDEMAGSELQLATAKCGDLVALEPSAMMGKLKDGEIRCLTEALTAAPKQTVKDKISRVLMADAWAKGDEDRWEAIVRRHLSEIDRSDPDLCYKFATQLSKKGPEYADEAMKWANVALENQSQWTGDVHVTRVYGLYRLRAVSAQAKWNSLESQYMKALTDELDKKRDEARNQTKTLSREWLEYAKVAGKDPTMALQMCVSAAGTSGFCEEATADAPSP